jgi:oligopeptide/dipeptide ABC transporter ATP-binding protein
VANVLDIRDLSVDFRTPRGRVHALRGVDITLPGNTILGVVGESGSGKSTVVWAVTRLLANNAVVESGEILFDGTDVLGLNARQLEQFRGEQVSIVFQDPMTSQIPVMSYARQMTDIQYRRRDRAATEKRRVAIDMMRRVGIPDPEQRVDQFPHQFSGGMRQRAGIAMALLMNPTLLIADEATTALDVTMEAQVIHLLRELRHELQATIMVVSHNLGLIAELCDEVVVMYAGEVVERGSVHEIFHDPSHPYTQALLECDPARVLERTRFLPTIPGDVPDLHRVPKGCVFAPRCPRAFDACSREEPSDHAITDHHLARCHLLDERFARSGEARPTRVAPDRTAPSPSCAAPQASPVNGAVLEVTDLRVRFRTMGAVKALLSRVDDPFVDAVLGATLSLGTGETLGLVGESGSGKTTLGRAALGLVRPHSGSIRFDGRELTTLSDAALKPLRRDIAMMFQDPVGSLSPRQTVRRLITEPFEIHGFKDRDLKEEAKRLCDMVGFPGNFLSRYPHELSGGQARRVGVARALALQPRLIIADEPTAGLDVSVQGEILNLMSDLQREHALSYLVITHNLSMVRHISDRLAIMYLGRIVEQSDCDSIFRHPAHPYTEALVKGVPLPDPDKRRNLVSIEGEVPSLTSRPSGCEFHTRCKYAQARCRTESPEFRELESDHSVRCHFPLNQ